MEGFVIQIRIQFISEDLTRFDNMRGFVSDRMYFP